MTDAPRTYADHVAEYAQAGWPCILPVPPRDKYPPPVGFTGAEGRDTDPIQLVEWAGSHAHSSIALRMPDGVIGIDVDEYVKGETTKTGAATLAVHEELWGPLPATWSSTARGTLHGPGQARIMFFRVPAQRYATKLEGPDVEIIQRHHRYAVVAPSTHPEGGTYTWYDPQLQPSDKVPGPMDLAELPAAWIAGLAEGATTAGPSAADPGSGWQLLEQLLDDWRPECAHITNSRLQAIDEVTRANAGSRHDTMAARVHGVILAAAQGHQGVAWSVTELRNAWANLTDGEDRGEEFERMLHTSARKAVTLVGVHQVVRDPCLREDEFAVFASAPEDAAGNPLEAIEPVRQYSIREVIGAHLFDPVAQLDQPLAQAVLERMYPITRYAYDSRGWLLRVPDRWELRGDLTQWAVAQVASLMPIGNPDGDKLSEEKSRSSRRARFNTQAGAGAIAKKMQALVAGGIHPCAITLSELDSQPHILWAGGLPWDLAACRADAPMESWLARMDPSTPHLHTAGVTPERIPTPLWDAFIEAVWPDPEIRHWALRVLSIALTGYPDRALPILIGDTGRGKTQIISLLMSVLGSYAHAADPRLMGEEGAKAHASIVFALKGRRLSFIDEGPREGKWAQERLKQLTGGGELTANQMNQNPITFRPTHTLVLTTNDEPVLTDPAIRARARLIPCDGDPELVRITRAAIGHTSGDAWRAEAPGVLAQMMAEAGAWLQDPTTGLVTAAPEKLRYLAETLGAEQDPIRVWVDEETEQFDPGTPSRELYQAFVASCRRSGMRADAVPSETKWGRALNRLGHTVTHTEHGKRRPLRVRSGGFLPGMSQPPAPTSAAQPDGLTPNPDGFLTGSNTNPSGAFTQVNHSESVQPDGSDGFSGSITPMRAHAPAHEAATPGFPQPVSQSVANTGIAANSQNSTRQEPEPKPKPKRQQTETARAKAAATREEKRQAAIDQASGARIDLPALVTRDGQVRTIALTDADALLRTITTTDAALTVDVENTGYPLGHRHYALRTIQLGGEHFAVVLDATDSAHIQTAAMHLEAATTLHAHSATADLVPLADAGLIDLEQAWAKMLDTVVLAKLADPASTGSDPGLKKLAQAVLGDEALSAQADEARKALFKAGKWLTETKVTTPLEKSGWAQVDHRTETMVRYDASDVLDDAALARRLPRPAPAVLERERIAQRMTARVAYTGLRVDGDHVQQLLDEHTRARTTHAEKVRAFGVDNPGSNPQVAEVLTKLGAPLPRTNTGRPSVAAGVLDPMKRAEGPIGDMVRAVLDYRHHDTAIGTFLEPYQQLVVNGDGRARPTVYTLAADTGRMSCVRPNLQQVPREGGFRACITADPGHRLISADFAGVELRVAAALSGDQSLREILQDSSRDLHWEIARLAFGPDATKADRYAVKRGVFGRIYGGGVAAIARGVGVSDAVAQQIIDALDTLLPQLTEWSRQVRDAVETGRSQFQTAGGRVIYLPEASPHAAPNYAIQGTARELLVDALIRWSDTPWGSATLLPVHDELVVMVPEDEADAATTELERCMTTELHGIPIIAEASEPSFAWADSV